MKQGIIFILLLGLGFSQTELTTRVYSLADYNFMNGGESYTLLELTGYDLDFGLKESGHIPPVG